MKAIKVLLLVIGVGGGAALWIGARHSSAACEVCDPSVHRCRPGPDSTCVGDDNGPHGPWCVSSSGCVFT